jgi:gliding motility-associated-like protein
MDTTNTCVRIIEDNFTLEIPNVFTPNGDGNNDVFTIKNSGVKELNLTIYNRWGTRIFDGSVVNNGGWDGKTNKGNMASDGTYYFVLKGVRDTGAEIEEKGYLTLLNGK